MSEEIKNEQVAEEVVKTTEEQIVEKFDSIVEEKTADKLTEEKAAEMIKSSEETTSAAIEEIKNSIMDLEAKTSAPAIIGDKMSNEIKFEKMDTELGPVTAQKFSAIKRQGDNTDVPGGRVDSTEPYFAIRQANPFRQYGTVLPASGGVIKLPSVSSIGWNSEATQPASPRTAGGASTSKNVIIETWVSENEYSLANLEDVPAMDSAIVGLMASNLGLTEAQDAVAVIKADSTPTSVTTGVAAGLPTAANVAGRMSMVKEALGSGYLGGSMWIVSRDLLARLEESNNNGLNYDLATGVRTLLGYPVIVSDELEDGGTAGNLVGVFGNISRGVALGSAAEMTIGRFDQTRPGSMTYFGRTRFKHSVWDESAIIKITVGA